MNTASIRGLPILFLLFLFVPLPTPLLADPSPDPHADPPSGWVKVNRERTPETAPPMEQEGRMVLMEMGYPGVFSPRILFPVRPRQTAGIGLILLPGLKGLVGEYRFHLIQQKRERFALHTGGGLVYYDIDSDERSSSAGGIFLSLGTTYATRSRLLLGGSLGLLNTTGSREDAPVESFGIRKDLSSTFVSFSVAYVF